MITAALPTYNNAEAIKIQLESLCNQVDAPEWELIVCEEPSSSYFGKKGLREYVSRLKAANCTRIKYLNLSEWCPLGEKWGIIASKMHPESVGFMLCASDNYSPDSRIKDSYKAMVEGFEWFQYNEGHFYDIHTRKAGLLKIKEGNPALFMCIAAQNMRELSRRNFKQYPRRGVDGWLFGATLAKSRKYAKHTNGVHTDGVNTISLSRKKQYNGPHASGFFTQADGAKVFELFSKEVQNYIKKLETCHT